MNLQGAMKLSGGRLWLEATFWRYGLLPFVSVLCAVIAALVWLLWVPKTHALIADQKHQLGVLDTQQRNGAILRAQKLVPPLMMFEQTLADPAKTNDVIRRVFELARANNVTITQSDYRRISNRDNAQNAQATQIELSQFQISLPVKGTYAQLKRFCLSLLAEMPALSIDQLALKRDTSNSNQVNAQLLLTLWERDSADTARIGPVAQEGKP